MTKAQRKASKKVVKRINKFGIALLWGQVRSGKTRPFLEASRGFKTLVITKKDAIEGILSEAKAIGIEVDVINYHSVSKIPNPDSYDLVILDECHLYIANASAKVSSIWKMVFDYTQKKRLIFASGTPTAEGYGGLYHMLKLSTWSPFRKYKRFTLWFEDYGVPKRKYIGTRDVPCYKTTQVDKIKAEIEHLVVRLKRKDTGHKYEAEDVTHVIPLSKKQSKMKKVLTKDLVLLTKQGDILADTPVKMLSKSHQIASGIAVKCEGDKVYRFKKEPPKVTFIKKHFDPKTTIILAHYKEDVAYLSKIFPHVGSVTKMSSGVDLSHYKTMIIYSMAFSSANFEQVRARLMNINRDSEIQVHYLLSDIDTYVYEAVKSKENFTLDWYRSNT